MITFSFTIARPSMIVKADGTLASGITVLTGSSGSGKSTFIKCIAGLV
ncbi:MAG: ABC transporter ATP-binding protein, partial [Veillonella dispar]|nr:ABC transporter ATP-binding protein [Veillonella dispar]